MFRRVNNDGDLGGCFEDILSSIVFKVPFHLSHNPFDIGMISRSMNIFC